MRTHMEKIPSSRHHNFYFPVGALHFGEDVSSKRRKRQPERQKTNALGSQRQIHIHLHLNLPSRSA